MAITTYSRTASRRAILAGVIALPALVATTGNAASSMEYGSTATKTLLCKRLVAFKAAYAEFLRSADGSGRYTDDAAAPRVLNREA